MPTRVKIRIRSLKGFRVGEIMETSSLLNTGYTGSSPEVIFPLRLAETLGVWPPPLGAIESTYDTAGGPVRFYMIKEAAIIRIVEEDVLSKELIVDVAVSPIEKEVLLSDYVIGELGIVILNAYRGYWRFDFDPLDKVRYGKRPELW